VKTIVKRARLKRRAFLVPKEILMLI